MAVPKAPLETLAVQTDSNVENSSDVGQQAKDLYGGIRSFNNQLIKIQAFQQEQARQETLKQI
jgi:hypothetical protein